MKKRNFEKLPMNLQFFAEGDGADDANNNAGGAEDSNAGGQNNGEDQNSGNNSGEKSFTQTEVNNMMTKEKNEGKRSILKSLGFKTEEEALKAIEGYNKFLESQKTEAEKNKEALDKANNEKANALKRATEAENKLAIYNAGVNNEYIEDVLAIAILKVTEEKNLETVLKEMKEDKKYESFFAKEISGGTGSNPGHGSNHNDGEKGYGERLAKRNANKETKSNYFND